MPSYFILIMPVPSTQPPLDHLHDLPRVNGVSVIQLIENLQLDHSTQKTFNHIIIFLNFFDKYEVYK